MTTSGGEIYAAFIEAELKAENDRRDSVNARAGAALTGATGFVTLALAKFAVLVPQSHIFTGWTKLFLAAALACLLGVGGCAVAAGFPWRQKLTSAQTLMKMLNSHRNDSEEIALDAVSFCNVQVTGSLRSRTSTKMRFLLAAGICQIVAIGAPTASVWAVVTAHG